MNVKLLLFVVFSALALSTRALAQQSTCYGTTSDGHLQNGVQLPASGKNFTGYSAIARLAGRTYVHSQVRDIILAAYSDLEKSQPDKVFKYAETGFKNGGQFKPHKTHRNGLSVDFMVPVVDKSGNSVHLPTNALNKFGYNIEFSTDSIYEKFAIDYEAFAAHLVALHKASINRGYDLWRVIFDPELQSNLLRTSHSDYLAKYIQFSKKRAWVRHDEHYHVDFKIPCK